jgi:hypothetical protein
MTRKGLIIIFWIIGWAAIALGQNAPAAIVLNGETLFEKRKLAAKGTDDLIGELVGRAGTIVRAARFYSVMNKAQIPPSGDKHDYLSQAPYWWPDPSKPNGLPYIRRDGERNPELNRISDSHEMDLLIEEAETTALAYFFTGDEKYAWHAAQLIRTWFIDPKTRQNPNLKFGQGIPGITTGRGIGLIETRELYRIIDAAILLEESKSWTANDRDQLKKWFADFLEWMLESELGKDEADEKNNHGTYYDVQIIAYALFAGRPEIARRQIEVTKERIKSQLETDGSQPHELARTLSWGYVNMNLLGFFTIARLAENVNVDLWNFETGDGKSIRKAFDWLVPFVKNEKSWTFQQIKPKGFEQTVRLLRLAARKYKNPEYLELARKLDEKAFQATDLQLGN